MYYTILYCTCTILYCTVLYYAVLYCTVLFCAVLYYTILYCTILYYTVIYCTILYYTILYYTIQNDTLLYYTILYYTILYNTLLFYAILYYTQSFLAGDKRRWLLQYKFCGVKKRAPLCKPGQEVILYTKNKVVPVWKNFCRWVNTVQYRHLIPEPVEPFKIILHTLEQGNRICPLWSLYKCMALWRAVYHAFASERWDSRCPSGYDDWLPSVMSQVQISARFP